MTTHSTYKQTVKTAAAWMMAALVCIFCGCHDDELANRSSQREADGTFTFNIYVPGYAVPTRATGEVSIDTAITTLHLYCFDEKGGFMGVVEADEAEGETSIDSGEKDNIWPSEANEQGTYSASIPTNTEVVHFVANAPKEILPGDGTYGLDMGYYKGLKAEEVIAPMVTTHHLYWGTCTYNELQEKKFNEEPVVLYRNYAKVTYKLATSDTSTETVAADAESSSAVAEIVSIDRWTLCNVPQNATVAPFDAEAIGQTKGPFHFNLSVESSRYASLPVYDQRKDLVNGTEEDMVSVNTDQLPQPLPLFDHTVAAYGKRVFAIFQITTQKGSEDEVKKFYKIELLKDKYNSDETIVVSREPFDIKRNHIYTINFKGINPDLGYDSFDGAVKGNPANNTLVDVEEALPELQSGISVLRVENGTVRYIDNLTTQYTEAEDDTYTVNDIQIYYSGPYDITAEWVTDSCHWNQETLPALTLTSTTDPEGNYTHLVSFPTKPFTYGDNGEKHYLEGLIRIRETGAGALSRFVRVYIGEPVSFRPLLISSDIPAMTDERITVAFTVPDERYLPTTLYPLEVRFGSNRIDVEKNIYVDAMKVELDQTADYTGVLEYADKDGDNTYAWTATKTIDNTWGYKYAYTIEEPADSGEHRITLRTTSAETTDFSVLMEGMSTVLLNGTGDADQADIFNTRELRFKVQASGTDNETAKRIMLNNGLTDTRLTTAYINKSVSEYNGNSMVEIPYTLGTFNDTDNTPTAATGISSDAPVNLWVYYRPTDLTPTGDLANKEVKTDPEGNTFVEYTATSATGSFTFNIKNSNVQNSLVFITARSGDGTTATDHPYGGTYTGVALGEQSHVYTGVNADDNAYRSASALVSVLSNWRFNPAPSTTNSNFEYADEFEVGYGVPNNEQDDYDLYVRIDRPNGASGVTLSIDTEGKYKLVENSTSYTIATDSDGSTKLDGSDGNPIQLTLTNEQSSTCVLHFRPLKFDTSCTMIFSNGEGSTTYDTSTKNTLTITNTPIAVHGIKYMHREDYNNLINNGQNTEVSGTNFSSSLNIDPTEGQQYVVRIYFPNELAGAVQDRTFTFKFATLRSEILSGYDANSNSITASTKYEVLEDNIVKVNSMKKEYLDADNDVVESTATGATQYTYIDLLLQSTEPASNETMRLSSGNDIRFYRYSVGIGNRTVYEAGSTEVKYELSADSGSTWHAVSHNGIYLNDDNLGNLYEKDKTYKLRVTYPTTGKDNNSPVDFTLKTSGFRVTGIDKTYKTFKVYDQTGKEMTSTDDSNSKGYYYVYKYTGISATLDSYTEQFTLTLQTVGYGLADVLRMEGRNAYILAEETKVMLATQYDQEGTEGKWEITKFSGSSPQTAADSRSGEDDEIFDVGAQINSNTIGEYSNAAKMDGVGYVSFYAPYANMKLNVGISKRYADKEAAPLGIYYNGNDVPFNNSISPTSTTEITDAAYTLGSAGLYQLKNGGGTEFYLYYISLEKSRTLKGFGDIGWKAADTDGSSAWSLYSDKGTLVSFPTASGTIADTDAENTSLTLSVSDFAEQLTLTFSGLTEEANLTLPVDGLYAFLVDNEKTYSATVAIGGSVTLVPAAGGELVEGAIQLNGYSSNYSYSQDITVSVRPYVVVTNTFTDDVTMGDEVTLTVSLEDVQHIGEALTYQVNGYDAYQNLTPLENINENWSSGKATVVNVTPNATGPLTIFKWRVETAAGRAIVQMRSTETTDVINQFGEILKRDGNSPIYVYMETLGRFKSRASHSQGYMQYSTDGVTWQYINGLNGSDDLLHAEQLAYQSATVETNAGGTYYIRTTIPAGGSTALTAANVAYTLGGTTTGVTVEQYVTTTDKIEKEDDVFNWAVFKVTNPSTEEQAYTLRFKGSVFADSSALVHVKTVTATQYTLTFYNESYVEGKTEYTSAGTVQYTPGKTFTLVDGSSLTAPTGKEFSHWALADGTEVTENSTFTEDTAIYPVWANKYLTVGTTEATVTASYVYESNNCKQSVHTTNQLIDSSYDGSYILFDIEPNESGWYSFTSTIATTLDGRSVTLGYVDESGNYTQSESITVENTGSWYENAVQSYTTYFYLTAGTRYTFKMLCDTPDGTGYCVNVYGVTVKRKDDVTSTRVELSPLHYTGSTTESTITTGWEFTDDNINISITNTNSSGKTYGAQKYNDGTDTTTRDFIKMSRSETFTIEGITDNYACVRAEFWGCSNSASNIQDGAETGLNWAYLYSISSGDYSWKQADTEEKNDNEVIKGYAYPYSPEAETAEAKPRATITPDTPWTENISYRFSGKNQVNAIIVLYLIPKADVDYYISSTDTTIPETPVLDQ